MPEEDPLVSAKEAAELLGIKPATWRSYVSRGQAPPPDEPDDEPGKPACHRFPRWRRSTVLGRVGRRKQGHRTDLDHAREARRRRDATDLAAVSIRPTAELAAWLARRATAVRAVAELLDDHRDELVEQAAGEAAQGLLEEAYNMMGRYLGRQEMTNGFASAVAHTLRLARAVSSADDELRSMLAARQQLFDEYELLRPQRR